MITSIYVCSKCMKASPDNSNIRRHVASCGEGATLQKKRARYEIIDDDNDDDVIGDNSCATENASPSMPHVQRRPAFDDEDADDARIEWLFEDSKRGCLKHLLNEKDITRLPAKLFDLLWGRNAPEEFQSVWSSKGKLHRVLTEDGTCTHNDFNRDALCDTATSLLEFMYSVATHSVPVRRPEWSEDAEACLKRLGETREMDGNLTLREALKKRKRTTGVRVVVSSLRECLVMN